MKYTVKAHPTRYAGVCFRSRLEARWAAFFDLVKWDWQYEPIDLPGWSPDFRVTFPCHHSECNGSHSLLVEVKPYFSIDEFKDHIAMYYSYGVLSEADARKFGSSLAQEIPAHASACFGNDPSVSKWEMGHGSGGGVDSLENWILEDINLLWAKAGNITQWKPKI